MEASELIALAEVEDRYWWYKERRSILAKELRRLPAPGTALDIGAAGGGKLWVGSNLGLFLLDPPAHLARAVKLDAAPDGRAPEDPGWQEHSARRPPCTACRPVRR